MSVAPLGYLSSAGERAAAIVPLTWFVLVVSVVVCIAIAALLLAAILRPRRRAPPEAISAGDGDGLGWIKWGLALSALPLIATLVWTMAALGRVVGPPRRPALVVDVTPRQYWWEVRYDARDPAESFVTANEIHVATGTRVLVRLHGGDVIHSFWVPQLSGKTDAIPGQTNLSWLEASAPGRYRGQCAEFCGLEHAKMAFEVVAEPPAAFAQWRRVQLQTAPPPRTDAERRGALYFQHRCASCHAVRGTGATARTAPDLTHLMSRRMIAAGTLPNTHGSLAGWVQAPQTSKPGAAMPDQKLTGQQLNDVLAYLVTLK